MVTVLREGMEAVIFVGGVSLGQPATSIPIAAIVGIVCGLIIGYLIYAFASRTSRSFFCACFRSSSLTPVNSFDHLPCRHDQLDSPHRCWFVQQGNRRLPGVQVRQTVRLRGSSCGIVDTNYRVVLFLRLGTDVDDAGGTGPGSYDVRGNVWHLDCCSPESKLDDQGWLVFNAILGWSNNGSLGQLDLS